MKFNNIKYRAIYLALFTVAIAVASYRLPAYAGRMPWIMLLAISDLYILWHLNKPFIFFNYPIRTGLQIITILPSVLLLCFLLSMAFLSPVDWNHVFRTYLLGIVMFFYIIRFFPLLALIISDLISLLSRRNKQATLHKAGLILLLRISFGLSAIIASVMIVGMTRCIYDFEVVEKKITIKGLAQEFENYRIVQISDLHLGRWHSEKPLKRAFNKVNTLNPDLIAFTGDLVNYATSEALPYKKLLAGLNANDGVYAVLGNHDYGDYIRWPNHEAKALNNRQMFDLLNDAGWIVLENTHINIFRANQCLTIAGTGNFSKKKHIPDRADIQGTLSGIPDSCNLILLTHTPEITDNKFPYNQTIDLMLTGHTHGLQVGLKIKGRHYSPAVLIYKYWGGLYEIELGENQRGKLYVNRGLGHIAFPFRIVMRPEITVLTLSAN